MRYDSTRLAFSKLNSELDKLHQAGTPLSLTIAGKPKLHILSFEPLAIERYGTFRNKAPYVAGELALRAFLTQPDEYSNGAVVYAGVEAGDQAYGFAMDGANPQSRATINNVARALGYALKFE